MPVTLALLVLLGSVGIIDVGWYHLVKLRLYRQYDARFEQLAHLSRGALFVAMLCLVVPGTPRGRWVDVGIAVFVVDFANTIVDTWIERTSRPRGLDHGEYMVHIAGSVLAGATSMAFAFEAWPFRAAPSAWVARTSPSWLGTIGWLGVTVVAAVVFVEAALHIRARASAIWARSWPAKEGES